MCSKNVEIRLTNEKKEWNGGGGGGGGGGGWQLTPISKLLVSPVNTN